MFEQRIPARPHRAAFWLLLCWAVFALGGNDEAAAAPAIDQLLPSATKLVLATGNLERFAQNWSQTSYGTLFDDPLLAPFRQSLPDGTRNTAPRMPPLGFSLQQMRDAATGESAIAMIATEAGTAARMVLLDATGNRKQARTVIEAVDERNRAAGAVRSSLTIAGQKVLVYRQEQTANDPDREVFYFFRDDLLGYCDDRSTLTELLTRWSADAGDSLRGNPSYRYALDKLDVDKRAADLIWFIEPLGLDSALRSEEDESADAELWRLLRRTGFQAIGGIGGSLTLADQGRTEWRMVVHRAEPLTQAARLLALRTVPQQPVPGWMPASVAMLRTLQLDFASALEGYGSWFEATEGEGEEGIFDLVLDDIKHEPGGPQLDIRADLIAQFTGPVYMASFVDRSAEIARETSAVAIKVKDAALVTESIRRFFSGDPDIITPPPSIGEHVVWNYRNARKPKDGKKQAMLGPDLSNVAVTVAHGYLIAAGNLETLRRVVESPDGEQPLSGDPRFSRARSLITELASGEPILWQFDRGQSSLLSTYDLLRAGRPDETSTIVGRLLTLYFDIVAGSAGKRPAGQPTPRWPGIDFEKLPPFEKVSHHLRDTVLSAENLEQGWLLIGTTVPE